VTSETYRRASSGSAEVEKADSKIDPDNRLVWKFPLQRLEAEPIRDALLVVAGRLDLCVGGKSFDDGKDGSNRRAAYMARGYLAYTNVMPDFLQSFDAEDGRMTCPRRNQTVTAPQALFMMNNELVEDVSGRFAERLKKEADGDVAKAITLGFRIALCRPPSDAERTKALDYVQGDPGRLTNVHWTHPLLAPLRDHPQLLEAVVAWFACDLNVNDAAARLHLHPNSLRYRLARVDEVTGRALHALPNLVDLYLALRSEARLPLEILQKAAPTSSSPPVPRPGRRS